MNKSDFVIGIQARSKSVRLPGKCLMHLYDKPVWRWCYNEAQATEIITTMLIPQGDFDMLVSCSDYSYLTGNSPLHRFCSLSSFYFQKRFIIRLTADCPLINRWIILDMAHQFEKNKCTFMYNELDGMDVQIADRSLFDHPDYLDEEHVFNMEKIKEHGLYTKYEMHLSIDTKEQFEYIKQMMEE